MRQQQASSSALSSQPLKNTANMIRIFCGEVFRLGHRDIQTQPGFVFALRARRLYDNIQTLRTPNLVPHHLSEACHQLISVATKIESEGLSGVTDRLPSVHANLCRDVSIRIASPFWNDVDQGEPSLRGNLCELRKPFEQAFGIHRYRSAIHHQRLNRRE